MAVALILAAGAGQRLGRDQPKAFVELAGRPMIEWSLDVFCAAPFIERVIVALPDGCELTNPSVTTVAGAASRSESMRNALSVADNADEIIVHDAARPFVSVDIIEASLVALTQADAAIAAVRASDTIKAVSSTGLVRETLNRSSLWTIQTPQAFRRQALDAALALAPEIIATATDDATLVERVGGNVVVVESTTANFKITTAFDLKLAEALIASEQPALSQV